MGMAQRVKEAGESECRSVMERIGIEPIRATLSYVKACPLPKPVQPEVNRPGFFGDLVS